MIIYIHHLLFLFLLYFYRNIICKTTIYFFMYLFIIPIIMHNKIMLNRSIRPTKQFLFNSNVLYSPIQHLHYYMFHLMHSTIKIIIIIHSNQYPIIHMILNTQKSTTNIYNHLYMLVIIDILNIFIYYLMYNYFIKVMYYFIFIFLFIAT